MKELSEYHPSRTRACDVQDRQHNKHSPITDMEQTKAISRHRVSASHSAHIYFTTHIHVQHPLAHKWRNAGSVGIRDFSEVTTALNLFIWETLSSQVRRRCTVQHTTISMVDMPVQQKCMFHRKYVASRDLRS